MSDGKDLVSPVSAIVAANQEPPKGRSVIAEIDGCLELLHMNEDLFMGEHFIQRLKSEQGWFEKLVSHAPSIGSFYEDSVRAIIKEQLPSQLKCGTGFIFDGATRRHSRQLDILIYNNRESAPIYRRGEFVVVTPNLAKAQAEIKKTLKLADLRTIIRSSVGSNFGTHPSDLKGCQRLCIFSFQCPSKTLAVYEAVRQEISDYLSHFECKTVDGDDVRFALNSIVLPRIYFLDRREYIEVMIHPAADRRHQRLSIGLYVSDASSSFAEFIDEMAFQSSSSTRTDSSRLICHDIRQVHKSETICDSVLVLHRIPIAELLQRFPKEADEIRNFRHRGRRPMALKLPASIGIERFESFEEVRCEDTGIWEYPHGDAK